MLKKRNSLWKNKLSVISQHESVSQRQASVSSPAQEANSTARKTDAFLLCTVLCFGDELAHYEGKTAGSVLMSGLLALREKHKGA